MKHFLVTQLNAILNRFGYRLNRYPKCLQDHPNQELTLSLEHAVASLAAKREFSAIRPLTIVQIGAFPTDSDPILLVRRSPYRLILIEPQPHAVAKLHERYRHNACVEIIGSAIGGSNGEATLYFADNSDKSLPAWVEQLASFSRSHLERFIPGLPILGARIRTTTVRVETLQALLGRLHAPFVDVLWIDTEGHDYEILKHAVCDSLRPSVIFFEHVHLSRTDREAAWSLLLKHGYRLAELGRDTLATVDQ